MDYASLAADATEILAEFGQDITLRQITVGDYDPATGSSTQTVVDTVRKAAIFDYTILLHGNQLNAGTVIENGDKNVFMDASGAAPTLSDNLIISGVTWSLKNIRTIAPAGIPVLFDLLTRR